MSQVFHLGGLLKGEEEVHSLFNLQNNQNNRIEVLSDHREINHQRARAIELTQQQLEQRQKEDKMKRDAENQLQNFITVIIITAYFSINNLTTLTLLIFSMEQKKS